VITADADLDGRRDHRTQPDQAGPAEDLFNGEYHRLAGWVRQQVDDDGTAREIASEAFVRLLSRWTRPRSPQRYLYPTAARLIRERGTSRLCSVNAAMARDNRPGSRRERILWRRVRRPRR
jgi:predicted RNA polymerase sigma factor